MGIAPASHPSTGHQLRTRGATTLQARGGGEYDVSDADIEAFYKETISGNGGDPPKGTITAELIVKFFYGETQKVVDDGKGWVWIAAEMSPGGLAIELFKSVPFGKRALFVAKASNVDEMFDKINWDLMDKRVDTTLGGPQVKQR